MHRLNLRSVFGAIRQKAKRVENATTRVFWNLQGKQAVHVLHIGKTGGTALKHAIRNHSTTGRYKIYLHPHGVRLVDIPDGDQVVFFLRDPINRFISGFYSRQRQPPSRWSSSERVAFEYFSTPNQLASALSSPDSDEKERARTAMKSIQHVASSYWEWFENEKYFASRLEDIFFVGSQERLTRDFEALKCKLGLPDAVALPDDDVQARRTPRNLDRSLEDQAIANLKKWYSDDYRFLDLCKANCLI